MKKTLLILVICLASLHIFAQTWTQIDSLPGTPRDGAISFVIDSMAYVGTGYDNGIFLSSFFQFHPNTGIWSQVASFPDSIEGGAGFAVNGKGYLVSGDADNSYVQTTYQYDPVANQWDTVSNFPGAGRQDAFGFATDSFGYVFGGHAGSGVVNDLWQYNPFTDSWTQKTSMPANPRSGPSGFMINGKVYIGLGGNDDGSVMYQDMYGYDPSNDTWDTITIFPGQIRRGAVGFSNNGLGYMGLGVYHDPVADTTGYYNDMYLYNPANNGWSPYTPLPAAGRAGAACFIIGNVAYVGGGADTVTLNDWWQLTDISGVPAIQVNNTISLYPDPASDIIRFEIGQVPGENGVLQIFDLPGERVKSIPLNGQQSIEVNVSDLPGGFYLYQLSDNGTVTTSGKFGVVR